MKIVSLIFVLLLGGQARATQLYNDTLVPGALANLGITTPFTGCFTCHGTTQAFGNFNSTFGAALVAEINRLGFTIAGDGVPNLNQTQMNTIFTNIQSADPDADTRLNRDEWIAGTRSDIFNPAAGGGGTTGGWCETNPELEFCDDEGGSGENSSSSSGPAIWNDSAYQLNPGCAAQETVMNETREIKAASFKHLAGLLMIWLLPIGVSLVRRRRSSESLKGR
jgi:hypothetical protein